MCRFAKQILNYLVKLASQGYQNWSLPKMISRIYVNFGSPLNQILD